MAIGGSAGGPGTLPKLVGDLPAAMLVTVHFNEHMPSNLAAILSHSGALPALRAGDEQPVCAGCVYVGRLPGTCCSPTGPQSLQQATDRHDCGPPSPHSKSARYSTATGYLRAAQRSTELAE